MHGKLGQTYVHGAYGNLCVCNAAQRTAARHIGTVGKNLHRRARLRAHPAEQRGGYAVGGVFLVGVELYHYALVHVGAVVAVRIFGVVGMLRMGIIRRYHEALRHHGKVFFFALAKVERYAAQKIAQYV